MSIMPILKSQGVPEGSGGWGEIADSLPRHQARITALIRHLLRKCHHTRGEGKKRLPLGEAVEQSETDEG
jgi:hypothetical protein